MESLLLDVRKYDGIFTSCMEMRLNVNVNYKERGLNFYI